jgi:hypothetical protein
VTDIEVLLVRYGSRITIVELSDDLLGAVDDILAAQTAAQLEPQLDRLRLLRRAMQTERQERTDGRAETAAPNDPRAPPSPFSPFPARACLMPNLRVPGGPPPATRSLMPLMPNGTVPAAVFFPRGSPDDRV